MNSKINFWASYFENPEEAKALLLDSVFTIPLYYMDEDGYYDIPSYFDELGESLKDNFRDPAPLYPISELETFIAEAHGQFHCNFRFRGESRSHRHQRQSFERAAGKTFLSWYKETKGEYPGADYSPVRFFHDYLAYEDAFPEAKCTESEEYRGYSSDDY